MCSCDKLMENLPKQSYSYSSRWSCGAINCILLCTQSRISPLINCRNSTWEELLLTSHRHSDESPRLHARPTALSSTPTRSSLTHRETKDTRAFESYGRNCLDFSWNISPTFLHLLNEVIFFITCSFLLFLHARWQPRRKQKTLP